MTKYTNKDAETAVIMVPEQVHDSHKILIGASPSSPESKLKKKCEL